MVYHISIFLKKIIDFVSDTKKICVQENKSSGILLRAQMSRMISN